MRLTLAVKVRILCGCAALSFLPFPAPLYGANPGLPFVEDFQSQSLLDNTRTTARWSNSGVTAGYILEYRNGLRNGNQRAYALGHPSFRLVSATGRLKIKDIVLEDMDADGYLDAVVASTGGIFIYFGKSGNLGSIQPVRISTKELFVALTVGDLDQDGDLDIAAAPNRKNVLLYENKGNRTFEASRSLRSNPRTIALVAADIDGDNHLDLVASERGPLIAVYLNSGGGRAIDFHGSNGSPAFWKGAYRSGDFNGGLGVGDLDGNGRLDVVIAKNHHRNVLYLNSHDNLDWTLNYGFSAYWTGYWRLDKKILPQTGDNFRHRGVALGDVNGDGSVDIVIGGHRVQHPMLYLNDGNANFSTGTEIGSNIARTFDVELADMDNDGDLDIVEGNPGAKDSRIYLNRDGIFDPFGFPICNGASAIAVGDMDGDGNQDVVLGRNTETLRVVKFVYPAGSTTQHYSAGREQVVSRKINGNAPVPRAVLLTASASSARPITHEIEYYLSNNGGVRWHRAYPGRSIRFPSPGDDLRWRAELKACTPHSGPSLLTEVRIRQATTQRRIAWRGLAPVAESKPISFTLSIGDEEAPSDGTVSVDWAISQHGEHPVSPNDFRGTRAWRNRYPSGTAVIPANLREVIVTVLTRNDRHVEVTETYTITLSEPVGGLLAGPSSSVGVIGMSDFDRLPLRPLKLAAAPAPVDEGADIRFTVAIDTQGLSCLVCHSATQRRYIPGVGFREEPRDFSVSIPSDLIPPLGTVAATWSIRGSGANPAIPSDFADAEGNPLTEFPSGVAVIPHEKRDVTITVPTFNSIENEGARTYTIALSNPRLGARLSTPVSQNGAINDNEPLPLRPNIPTTPTTVAEGTTLTFTVVFGDGETPAETPVRVAWNISSGADVLSTVTPQDFADAEGNALEDFPGGVAFIARGSTSTEVSVVTFDDLVNEATETYTITVVDTAGAVPLPSASTWTNVIRRAAISSTQTGAISDRADETVITIASDRSRVDEGTTVTFTVTLSGGNPADVEVPFTVTVDDNGATSVNARPDGYIYGFVWPDNNTGYFMLGHTTGSVTTRLTATTDIATVVIALTITDDDLYEEDETLRVSLGTPRTSAGSARLGAASSAAVTINASDLSSARHISLEPLSRVQEGATMTFTVSIGDDEPVSGGAISVEWALNSGRVWLGYRWSFWASASDFADADGNPLENPSSMLDTYLRGTAVIPAGKRSVVVGIPTYDDNHYDPNERFKVTLSNPAGAILNGPFSRSASFYDSNSDLYEVPVYKLNLLAPEPVEEGEPIRFTITATAYPEAGLFCADRPWGCIFHDPAGRTRQFGVTWIDEWVARIRRGSSGDAFYRENGLTRGVNLRPTRIHVNWSIPNPAVRHGITAGVVSLHDFYPFDIAERLKGYYSIYGYVGGARKASISVGSTSVTVAVPTINDNLAEGPESYNIRIFSDLRYGGLVPNYAIQRSGIINDDDSPLPSLAIPTTPTTVAEGTTLTFTVALGDGEPPAPTTTSVAWNISTGADTLTTVTPQDFVDTEGNALTDFPGGVAVIPRGSTATVVSVATFDDIVNEATETYTITLADMAGAAILSTQTGAISDRADETVITIAADRSRVDEGTTAAFTVTLSGGTRTADVEVPFTVTVDDNGDTSANARPDGHIYGFVWPDNDTGYFMVGNTTGSVTTILTATTATTTVRITLTITDDDLYEEEETLQVSLGTPRTPAGGVRLGVASSAAITINASDPLSLRHISLEPLSWVQEGATMTFTVSIGADEPVAESAVSVEWAVSGATDPAIDDRIQRPASASDFADARGNALTDYPHGTAVIPAGKRSVVVSVPTYDNTTYDPNDIFKVTLSNPGGGILNGPFSRIAGIGDRYDDLYQIPVRRISYLPPAPVEEGEPVRLTITAPVDSEAGLFCGDYPFGCILHYSAVFSHRGDSYRASVTRLFNYYRFPSLPIIRGSEGDDFYRDNGLMHGANLRPRGSADGHWFMREGNDTGCVNCVPAVKPGNWVSHNDFVNSGSKWPHLIFRRYFSIPGDSTSVTITLPTVNDGLVEGAESYTVGLTGYWSTGGLVPVGFGEDTGVINDNDYPLPPLAIPTTPMTVAEGTTLTFTVALNDGETPAPTTTSVAWNISTGADILTTVTPQDFVDTEGNALTNFPGGVAVIPRGSTATVVSVATFDDIANEATETYTITLADMVGAAILSTQTGAISDRADETVVTIAADQSRVDEGTTAAFTVTLSGGTRTADVEVPFTVTVDDNGDTSANARPDGHIYGFVWPDNTTGYFMVGNTTGSVTTMLTATSDIATVVITLTITDDDLYEEDETLQVSLGTPRTPAGSVRLGDARSAAMIVNASDLSSARHISLEPLSWVQEGAAMSFTVSIGDDEPVSDGAVSVAWAVSSATAPLIDSRFQRPASASDFADAGGNALTAYPHGTAVIPAGQRSVTVWVPTYDDTTYDQNDIFKVTLSNPAGGALNGPFSRIAGIHDSNGDLYEIPVRRVDLVAPAPVEEGDPIRITFIATNLEARLFCSGSFFGCIYHDPAATNPTKFILPYNGVQETPHPHPDPWACGDFGCVHPDFESSYGVQKTPYLKPVLGGRGDDFYRANGLTPGANLHPVDVGLYWHIGNAPHSYYQSRDGNLVSPEDFADDDGTPHKDFHAVSGFSKDLWESDYRPVTIPAGVTSVTVTVPTFNDDLIEGPEIYYAAHSSHIYFWNHWFENGQKVWHAGIINDNDQPLLPPTIPTTPTTVAEGATLTFTVVLGDGETPAQSSGSVAWTISSGVDVLSTVTPQDFADAEGNALEDFPGGVAFIARGSTSTAVSVATFDDIVNEATETYTITIADPAGSTRLPSASIWTNVTRRVSILSTQTGAISDRADETVVTIAADRSRVDEGTSATFVVTLSGGTRTADVEVPFTVTVSDNGVTGANARPDGRIYGFVWPDNNTGYFMVGNTTGSVTTTLTATSDIATVVITLTITDDDLYEEEEILQVSLGTPRTPAGSVRLGDARSAAIIINASDLSSARHISLEPLSWVQEGATMSFTVSIGADEPVSDGAVSVAWAVSGATDPAIDDRIQRPAGASDFADVGGNALTDYPHGTALIPSGRRSVVIRVPTYDDTTYDPNDIFKVTLSNPVGGMLNGPFSRIAGTHDSNSDLYEIPVRLFSLLPAEPVFEGEPIRVTIVAVDDPESALFCGDRPFGCIFHNPGVTTRRFYTSGDVHHFGESSFLPKLITGSQGNDFYRDNDLTRGANLRPRPHLHRLEWSVWNRGSERATDWMKREDFVRPAEGFYWHSFYVFRNDIYIPADTTSVTITLPTEDDDLLEGPERYYFQLGNWHGERGGAFVRDGRQGVLEAITGTLNDNDQPLPPPTIPTTPTTVAEGATLTFTVVLGDGETPAQSSASVAWTISSGADVLSTVTPQDFADAEGNVLEDFPGGVAFIARGSTSTVVSVATFDDIVNEATETYTITIADPAGSTRLPSASTWTNVTRRVAILSTQTGAISDRADETVVTIAADQREVDEGATATFTVTLSGGTRTADVEVPFTVTVRGGAGRYGRSLICSGTDTLTATSATTTVSITRTITDDLFTALCGRPVSLSSLPLPEGEEILRVTLGTPRTPAGSVRLGDERSAAIILNPRDLPSRHISLEPLSWVQEGAAMSFTVSIGDDEPASDGLVSVAWAVSGATDTALNRHIQRPASASDFADAGGNALTDYPRGTAVIPAGKRSAVVRVPTYDDTTYDPNDIFKVTLSDPVGGSLNGPFSRIAGTHDSNSDLYEIPVRKIDFLADPAPVEEGEPVRFTIAATDAPEIGLFCGGGPFGCIFHDPEGLTLFIRSSNHASLALPNELPQLIRGGKGDAFYRANGLTRGANLRPAGSAHAGWSIPWSQSLGGGAPVSREDFTDVHGISSDFFVSGTASIPPALTSVTVTLPTTNDDLIEEPESYTIFLDVSIAIPGYGFFTPGWTTWRNGILNDNDQPLPPTIPTTPTTVAEGTTLTFTIVLGDGETPAQSSASVAWTISSGADALSTVTPQDFADAEGNALEDFPGGVAFIARGLTSTVVSVATFDDLVNEATETCTITLNDMAGAAILSTQTGVISDRADETVVTIAAAQSSVDEGATATFTVTLSGGTRTADVEVPLMVAAPDGFIDGAVWISDGQDGFVVVNTISSETTPLTIPATTTRVGISLIVSDDDLFEDEETLQVSLGTPRTPAGSVRLGDARSAATTINASDRNVTVGFSAFPAPTATCSQPPCVNESAGAVQLCVDLLSPPRSAALGDAQISLNATTVAGSAAAADYTALNGHTVVSLNDDSRRRCFSVALTDDASPENAETFDVILAASQTTGVDEVTVAPNSATVTIQDNDVIHVGWAPQSRAVTVREGDGAVTLTAVILSPSADVPIASDDFRLTVNISGRAAVAPGDSIAPANRVIAFSDTARSASVVIPILDDDISEMTTETFIARLDFIATDRVTAPVVLPSRSVIVAVVSIEPSDPPMLEPTVNAGSDRTAVAESADPGMVGATTVTLEGTVARNVSDTDSTLLYTWEQVSGDSTAATVIEPGHADFVDPTGGTNEAGVSGAGGVSGASDTTVPVTAAAFFTAPDVMHSKTYYFRLTAVAAGAGTRSDPVSDIVAVTINDMEPPTVVASVRHSTVMEGATSTLVGVATDPDGDPDLRYEWTQSPATPPLVIAGTATPVVTWPDVAASGRGQVFTLTLTVTDSQGLIGTDSVVVLVQDNDVTVTIGPASQSVQEGGEATFTVTLTGGRPSSDIIVPYTVSFVGASSDDYIDANKGSFIIAADSIAPHTFTIRIREDDIRESGEALMITLGIPGMAPGHKTRESSGPTAVRTAAGAVEAPGFGSMGVGDADSAIVTIHDGSSLRVRVRVFLQGAMMGVGDTP